MSEPKHTPGLDIRGACDKMGACNTLAENADGQGKSKADPVACPVPQQTQSDGAKPIQTSDVLKSTVGLSADSGANQITQTDASGLSAETIQRLQGESGILGNSGLLAESLPQTNCAKSGQLQKDCASTVESSFQNLDSTQKTRVASTISRRARKVDNMPQSTSSFPVDNATLAKATPGPWYVQPDPEYHNTEFAAYHAHRFITCGNPDITSDEWQHDPNSYIIASLRDCQNQAANAALIARAPDLLAENQRLREALREIAETPPAGRVIEWAVSTARAALSAERGAKE